MLTHTRAEKPGLHSLQCTLSQDWKLWHFYVSQCHICAVTWHHLKQIFRIIFNVWWIFNTLVPPHWIQFQEKITHWFFFLWTSWHQIGITLCNNHVTEHTVSGNTAVYLLPTVSGQCIQHSIWHIISHDTYPAKANKLIRTTLISQPAWLNAKGIVKAPVPTMRLNMKMRPTCDWKKKISMTDV